MIIDIDWRGEEQKPSVVNSCVSSTFDILIDDVGEVDSPRYELEGTFISYESDGSINISKFCECEDVDKKLYSPSYFTVSCSVPEGANIEMLHRSTIDKWLYNLVTTRHNLLVAPKNYRFTDDDSFGQLSFFNDAFMIVESNDLIVSQILIHPDDLSYCKKSLGKNYDGGLWTATINTLDRISRGSAIVLAACDYIGCISVRKDWTETTRGNWEAEIAMFINPETIAWYGSTRRKPMGEV